MSTDVLVQWSPPEVVVVGEADDDAGTPGGRVRSGEDDE